MTSRRPAIAAAVTGLTLAGVLFALITLWRFSSVSDPMAGVAFLYIVPTAVVAARLGTAGGLVAAVLSVVLVLLWDTVRGIGLDAEDYFVRALAFVSVALLVGWQSRARHAHEREAERWFSMSNDLVCIADFRGYFTRVNDSWTNLLGYDREELLGRPYLDFVHPDDLEQTIAFAASLAAQNHAVAGFDNRYRAKDGTWHWLLWSARSDGDRIYGVAKDNTVRKQLEEELVRVALRDVLTGAANRRACNERLLLEMSRARRSGDPLALAMLDLDRLKETNDRHGHAAGDSLLIGAVAAWRSVLRDVDLLARVGGDEFCVLLPNTDAASAERIVQRMLTAMPAGSTFSAGVAVWNGEEAATEFMGRADAGLYQAKREGRGCVRQAAEPDGRLTPARSAIAPASAAKP